MVKRNCYGPSNEKQGGSRKMKLIIILPLFFFFLGCQENKPLLAIPEPTKPPNFDDIIAMADFVGIVEILKMPQGTFHEDNPPIILARSDQVLKGKEEEKISIIWQTKPELAEPIDNITKPIKMPLLEKKYMVYLIKKGNAYERCNQRLSFLLMPEGSRMIIITKRWRFVFEVFPYISKVGDPIFYRYCRTQVGKELYEGKGKRFSFINQTVYDFTRKKKVNPKVTGKYIDVSEYVPKGSTIIDEIELTKMYDLTKPGEYWLFEFGVPLRFEISDKIQIHRPEQK